MQSRMAWPANSSTSLQVCTFWKVAAQGKVFYTAASEHFGCPVGAFTLGAELPEPETQELHKLATTMVELSYLSEREVAQLPRRMPLLRYVICAPLGMNPTFPDVVLVHGNARQLMLLGDAARAVGRLNDSPAMGKPACTMVPASLASNQAVVSLGSALEPICARLSDTLKANEAAQGFHGQRYDVATTA